MANAIAITTPVGRIVMGSLYTPSTTDAEGKPLVVKTGPNAGQPRVNYFFALAIPKEAGQTHWAERPSRHRNPQNKQDMDDAARPYWGETIWQIGHTAHPQAAGSRAFAWKIEDGDSQEPNKKGKRPCDNEGWRGHWILKFSGGYAPSVYEADGSAFKQILQKDFVKPGYFVEVNFTCDGNGSTSQPGVYLNHKMVNFRAYGAEITFGPDVSQAGFGGGALPAGASMTPPPGAHPMPAQVPVPGQVPGYAPAAGGMTVPQTAYAAPVAGVPNVPGVPLPLAPAGSVPQQYAPAAIAPAPIPVMPIPGFAQVPPPNAAPMAPVAPVAPPARQMTPLANGIPYEAYIAQGWTDALLVQNGMMIA